MVETKKTGQWFEVSREGLRELQEGKPKHFIARELVQNAWDENSDTAVQAAWNEGVVTLVVQDNSEEGFRDLAHAFTLFAPTYKRADPEKRGRFNLGEKQALAVCDYAKISTTKGTVIFNKEGRQETNQKSRSGSIVEVSFKCNKAEFEEILAVIKSYRAPTKLKYTINGVEPKPSTPFRTVNVDLPTVIQIDNALRHSHRKTDVDILSVVGNGTLYEMGIPVCAIDCDYSIDVQQKVPLTPDRESVTEAYISKLFAIVFNAVHDQLPEGSESRAWVRVAMEHPAIDKAAVQAWVKKIYGDKVVVANMRDKNSIDEAISKGYRVIYPNELSKATWDNIKDAGKESGSTLVPSSSALFGQSITTLAKHVEPTLDMAYVGVLAKKIAKRCLGLDIRVEFRSWDGNVSAQYSQGTITFNVGNLGKTWFSPPVSAKGLDLIIHELSHAEGNHTEHSYHEAMTRMAGELIIIALNEPLFFTIQENEL
jgi:hypothetical protein